MRPEHLAHGGVTLRTVQCRPASAYAGKCPPRGCTLKKQDKTRQDKRSRTSFKAASLQEKAANKVWFKSVGSKNVGRNKYAMFDEVARDRGAWDDLCVEPQVRALAERGFCKPCKQFYDHNKGLEAHEKRHHPRLPGPSDDRGADGEREA